MAAQPEPLTKQQRAGAIVATQDLSYSVSNPFGKPRRVQILRNVNICCRPGYLTAIVGPSGCGKTTLLNSIARRTKAGRCKGKILHSGVELPTATLQRLTNYVMAHDRLHPYLTVEETMKNACRLKLPHLTKAEIKQKVYEIMQQVGLLDCRHTYIGGDWKKGISSGERKRLCVAMELLDEPMVLLLDEPTSGLDSTLAFDLVQILKSVAQTGVTVVCTIHQPRSQVFALFDELILMSTGRVVYHGKSDHVPEYFARCGFVCPMNYNPADYILELVAPRVAIDKDLEFHSETSSSSSSSGSSRQKKNRLKILEEITVPHLNPTQIEHLCDHFARSEESSRVEAMISESIRTPGDFEEYSAGRYFKRHLQRQTWANWFREIKVLWKRTTMNGIRNPWVTIVILLINIAQGCVLGGIFYGMAKEPDYSSSSSVASLNSLISSSMGISESDGNFSLPYSSISPFSDAVRCAVEAYHLEDFGYPPLPYDLYENNDTNENDVPEYPPVLFAKAGALQLIDFAVRSLDRTVLTECFISERKNWIGVLDCLAETAETHLTPALNCLGLPSLERLDIPVVNGLEWLEEKQTSSMCSAVKKENGLIFPVTHIAHEGECEKPTAEIENSLEETTHAMQMVKTLGNSALRLLERMTKCGNSLCSTIASSVETAGSSIVDFLTTTLSTLSISGNLFFNVAALGFASYDVLLSFPQERAIFNRETANGLYRCSSYYIGKTFGDLPFQILPCICFSTIYYFLVGMAPTARQFFVFIGVSMLTNFASYGFGYLVSAAAGRMEVAVLVAPLTLVIWLVIAGLFIRDYDIPPWINWFKYTSIYRWGYIALVLNQFPPGTTWGGIPTELAIAVAGVSNDSLLIPCLSLAGLACGFRVLGFFFLKYLNRHVGQEA